MAMAFQADKIVNNFHGQNRFQFHCQTPIFMVKTLVFVVKTDFSCSGLQIFLITKYLGHKFLGQSPFHSNAIPFQFYAQLRSIPTAFHGQSRFRGAVTVSTYLHPKSATPSCLPSVSFERSLGTVTVLHRRCRIQSFFFFFFFF